MHERIAKITSTHLGYEDHGIFTAMLQVDYGGSGQGVGGYILDQPARDRPDGGSSRRKGTEFGMEWILRCMAACGVREWGAIKGRTILVLFEDDNWNARPIGIGPLPTEKGEPFVFADLSREMES